MEYTYLGIEYSHDDKIATVTLQRPEVRNALNTGLIEELTAAFTTLSSDERLHGVILTGKGKAFCAGADIGVMHDAITYTEEENVADALRLADLLDQIYHFPCPVVARINGDAIGGGVGLVAACDIAIAAEQVRFAFSEVKLGIAPAVIAPYVLRKIGESYARVLFVTGERFSVQRAAQFGLVHAIVGAEDLDERVNSCVRELVNGAPQAIRTCKQLALEVGQMSNSEARTYTANTIARLRVSEEGQEGLRAFLEKRKPDWI